MYTAGMNRYMLGNSGLSRSTWCSISEAAASVALEARETAWVQGVGEGNMGNPTGGRS